MSGLTWVIERRTLLVGALACGVASMGRAMGERRAPSGVAGLPIPPSRALAFQLMRHDSAIGTHTLDFKVEDDTLTVQIVVDVLFTLGPIPLVHYTHRNTEVWRGGRLSRLEAHTDRNGTELYMSAHRVAAGLRVEGSGTSPYIAPEDALPTTYWNARMLHVPMIGTQDGILVHPRVTEKPIEPVRLASGAETAARCYSLTGDLDLELWYDPESRWMSMRFRVADGSVISYERL
jgi:hypothetical protein